MKPAFTKKRVSIWLLYAGFHWLLLLLAMISFFKIEFIFIKVFLILVIGSRQHAIAGLGHDGGHYLVAENKKLNDFLTNLFCFYPLGIAIEGYRKFHMQHHFHLGGSNDPELLHKSWSKKEWNLPVKPFFFAKILLKDFLGGGVFEVPRLMRLTRPPFIHQVLPPVLFLLCANLCFLYLELWPYLALWYFSLISTFWGMFRMRIWLEHMGTKDTHRVKIPWILERLYAPVGFMYHWEHHKYQNVPFYYLSQIRNLDKSEPIMSQRQLLKKYQFSEISK